MQLLPAISMLIFPVKNRFVLIQLEFHIIIIDVGVLSSVRICLKNFCES